MHDVPSSFGRSPEAGATRDLRNVAVCAGVLVAVLGLKSGLDTVANNLKDSSVATVDSDSRPPVHVASLDVSPPAVANILADNPGIFSPDSPTQLPSLRAVQISSK